MSTVSYLEDTIIAIKRTDRPRWGMAASGYTLSNGAPTCTMIKLLGEKFWRRLMIIQFSNIGSCFVKVHGKRLFVADYMLPKV